MSEESGVTDGAAVAETHSAVVVFIGDHVYKIKKPVDLGFLDFSTVAARREAAHREVELNRRLAPDVYVGVADIIGPALAERLPLVVLRTDELRARPPEASNAHGDGRYAPAAVAANYRSMLDRARDLLRSGESVILDGSWSSAELRTLASTLASATSSDLVELCCVAPSSVTDTRIIERMRRADDPSEATPAIADRMAATFDAWPTAELIDTSRPLAAAIAIAVGQIAPTGPLPPGTAPVRDSNR